MHKLVIHPRAHHYVIVVQYLAIPSFQFLVSFQCQHVVLIFPYSLNTIQSIVVQSLNECSVTKEVKKILAYVVFSPSTKSRTTNSPTSSLFCGCGLLFLIQVKVICISSIGFTSYPCFETPSNWFGPHIMFHP